MKRAPHSPRRAPDANVAKTDNNHLEDTGKAIPGEESALAPGSHDSGLSCSSEQVCGETYVIAGDREWSAPRNAGTTSRDEFDPLLLLRQPERCVAPTAWVGHIPFALWVVREVKPKLLVELGTHSGNSYCAFCQSVVEGQLATICYAVDTWQGDEQAGLYGQEVLADLKLHHDRRYGAFSTLLQSTFDDALPFFGDGTIDFLHIDGCHTYENVKRDFESWHPKLSSNAIVLFHDTVVRNNAFGVWRLWDELRIAYPSFSFSHSHGLGVLAIGEVPPVLLPLFEARGQRIAEIRSLFGLIGSGLRERVESRLLAERCERDSVLALAEADAANRRCADLSDRLQQANIHGQVLDSNFKEISNRSADLGGAVLSVRSQLEGWVAEFRGALKALNADTENYRRQLCTNENAFTQFAEFIRSKEEEFRSKFSSSVDLILSAVAENRQIQSAKSLDDANKILELRADIDKLTSIVAKLPTLIRSERRPLENEVSSLRELMASDLHSALSQAQIEAAKLRRRMNDVVLDATIAWTRYSDVLGFIDRLATGAGHADAKALNALVNESRLEAHRQKVAVIRNSAEPNSIKRLEASVDSVRRPVQSRVTSFNRLIIGQDTSLAPILTLICASDQRDVDFGKLVDSIRSRAPRIPIEIFVQVSRPETAESSSDEWCGVDLVAEIDRVVFGRAQGSRIAIASVAGSLGDDWFEGLESSLAQNGLAVAACGIVLTNPTEVGWSGAALSAEDGWQLADRHLSIHDYRVASAAILDGIAPGLVAFVPDLYRELGGLARGQASLATALLEFSVRASAAGLEVYRAPKAQLNLSSAMGTGEDEALHFKNAARDASQPQKRYRPQVLVVDALTPTPDRDAGSMDAFWGMHILQSLGYEVTFVPMYDVSHAGRYTDALRARGIYCPVAPQLTTSQEFIKQHASEYDLIVIYRVSVAHVLVDLCRLHAPQAKIVFHTVDLHFLREERQAALFGTPEAVAQAEATKREELRCIASVDATIVVSRLEYDLVSELVPSAVRFLVPVMHPAPGRLAPRHGRQGIIFVGGFAHEPNVDAVKFMLDEVWPLLRRAMPDLTISIIGSGAPPEILARHDLGQGVDILGFVPELVPHYTKALVNVAPIRFGAGIKGKVLAAMTVGLPTIATSAAAEGMGLKSGSDIIIADDPREIADAVIRLCTDEELWYQISNSASVTAQAEFSVDAQVPRWRRILKSLALPA